MNTFVNVLSRSKRSNGRPCPRYLHGELIPYRGVLSGRARIRRLSRDSRDPLQSDFCTTYQSISRLRYAAISWALTSLAYLRVLFPLAVLRHHRRLLLPLHFPHIRFILPRGKNKKCARPVLSSTGFLLLRTSVQCETPQCHARRIVCGPRERIARGRQHRASDGRFRIVPALVVGRPLRRARSLVAGGLPYYQAHGVGIIQLDAAAALAVAR